MRTQKMWAVINRNGDAISVGMTRREAIQEACIVDFSVDKREWRRDKKNGCRCIKVLVTEAEQDEEEENG